MTGDMGLSRSGLKPRKPRKRSGKPSKPSVGATNSVWFNKQPTTTPVQKTTMNTPEPKPTPKPSLNRATGGKKLSPTVNKLTNATITPKSNSSSTLKSAQKLANMFAKDSKMNNFGKRVSSKSEGTKDMENNWSKMKQKVGRIDNDLHASVGAGGNPNELKAGHNNTKRKGKSGKLKNSKPKYKKL